MRSKLTIAVATATSAALLAAPAGADAKLWKGKTKQGRVVSVRTGADGLVTAVRIRWKSRCDDGRTLTGRTGFRPPFDRSEPRGFEDGGEYPDETTSGLTSTNTAFVRGTLTRGGPWRGRFHITSVLQRNGRTVATCRLRSTRWTARSR